VLRKKSLMWLRKKRGSQENRETNKKGFSLYGDSMEGRLTPAWEETNFSASEKAAASSRECVSIKRSLSDRKKTKGEGEGKRREEGGRYKWFSYYKKKDVS